jgi:hypothetical protein
MLARMGRGFGKDTVAVPAVVGRLISAPPKSTIIYWIANLHSENKKTIEIINRANKTGALKINKSSPYRVEYNGNAIEFYSFENADSIRGKNFANYVVINEAPLMKDEVWSAIVQPILGFKTVKRVLIMGTPKGRNWFYELWQAGFENGDFKLFAGTSYDNPFRDVSEIERAKKSAPEIVFRQEYLAEFVDSSGMVYSDIDQYIWKDGYGEPAETNFGGLDIGQSHDYSVLTIINPRGETVYTDRFKGLSWDEFHVRVKNSILRYKALTMCDSTGAGAPPVERLFNEMPELITEFTFTSSKKEKLVQNHLFALNCGLRQPSKSETFLREEMVHYEVTGGIARRYGARGGYHDDVLTADQLAVWSRSANQ